MRIAEQNKEMKEALEQLEQEIRRIRIYLSTSPKFQGTDNGERKDWISTREACGLLNNLGQVFMGLEDKGIDYKAKEASHETL